MPTFRWTALALVLLTVPPAAALHDVDCTPTSADPGAYLTIDLVPGSVYYWEVRDNPFGVPIPFSGFFFGPGCGCETIPPVLNEEYRGDWVYEETNGLPRLQRGGVGPLGGLLPQADFIQDETCGHGPDRLVLAVW